MEEEEEEEDTDTSVEVKVGRRVWSRDFGRRIGLEFF